MFRLDWIQSALEELTNNWLRADSVLRQAITRAIDEIEMCLLRNPHGEGESRSNGQRITFVPPLAITFRVEADGETVTVLQARLFLPHGR